MFRLCWNVVVCLLLFVTCWFTVAVAVTVCFCLFVVVCRLLLGRCWFAVDSLLFVCCCLIVFVWLVGCCCSFVVICCLLAVAYLLLVYRCSFNEKFLWSDAVKAREPLNTKIAENLIIVD